MSSPGRRRNPPSVRCSGTAKHTGKACRGWAIPGLTTCKHHGGLGGRAGRAAAEERAGATLTLAEMMARNPDRPIWAVILDSIRTVDVLAQAAKNDVAAGKVTSAEGIERVAGLARAAHSMASSAVAARALDMAAKAADSWGDMMADRLVALIGDWLGLPTGGSVGHALQVTLGDLDLTEQRTLTTAPDGPPLMDVVGQLLAAALSPHLGLPSGELAAWFARVVEATVDGRPVPDLPGAPVAALPPAPAPEVETDSGPDQAAVLTLHSQAGPDDEAEETEVVDAELVEPEPDARPRTTTALGYRPAPPSLPSSYRTFR